MKKVIYLSSLFIGAAALTGCGSHYNHASYYPYSHTVVTGHHYVAPARVVTQVPVMVPQVIAPRVISPRVVMPTYSTYAPLVTHSPVCADLCL